jgi:hypothetical protein
MTPDQFILEALPDDVVASIAERDAYIRSLPPAGGGVEFVVADLQKWRPGRTIRVAFLGGNTALHQDIEDATQQITQTCNLHLDFGRNATTGAYRTWSENDVDYVAEIRVSFDQGGFFSLVGTDSIDPGVGHPLSPVGGRANQRSLNLGGFPIRRPDNWRGVVRHEFMHALAFHHSHQNLRGPCEESFRWDDDAGYQQTTNSNGSFVADGQGRRPGIYTFLSGPPNGWPRPKVDHNLRRVVSDDVTVGPFDRASIMLYRFPDIFYKTVPSPCAPNGDGIELSDGDKRGLALMYPHTHSDITEANRRNDAMLEAIKPMAQQQPGLETVETAGSDVARRVAAVLRRR